MSALLVPDVPGSVAVDDLSSWLTVVLRPAGELAARDAVRLARALVRSCAAADAREGLPVVPGTRHVDVSRWDPLFYVFRHYLGPPLGANFRAEH